jgi:hypothetical protein
MSQDVMFVSPSPSSSAATSTALHLLESEQRLPFFVYGTLCSGFVNWEHYIKVLLSGAPLFP